MREEGRGRWMVVPATNEAAEDGAKEALGIPHTHQRPDHVRRRVLRDER